MAIAPTAGEPSVTTSETVTGQPWPSESRGWFALFVVVFATFVTFFDQTVFGMLSERMKQSFGISDSTLGLLQGPVTVVAYVIVGIPLARLVDIFPRKYVLGASIAVLGSIMALGGLAQSFRQLVFTRLFVGAASSANGPGSYSLLVDSFRPFRIPLVFALLQLGFIGGTSLGAIIGGQMIGYTSTLPETISFLGLPIFNWQLVLLMIGAPGLVAGLLYMLVKEPPRRSPPEASALTAPDAPLARKFAAFMGWDALKAIWARKAVFLPLFGALAMSAIESQGLIPWRVPFIARTYGWNEAEIGALLGTLFLFAMLAGITVGGIFVTWMGKRYKDANIRATAIIFVCTTTVTIVTPLMPTAELAIGMMALGTFFGLAGAPAQNAAIQRIAPNAMRGQVSAFYLFMFTFFGALGSWVIGAVSTYIVGDEQQLWKALLITGVAFLPLATFLMWRGIRPYREEVERLEAVGL
ncbi:MFS transporter [Altererythrobacter salegens]|uniref:MFS transporter n=1 Tax=Croceibacterium salegens TaxID=1737568 RepID=A0A6I4SUC2_9SPHN|nr:MFS transporter [Croceibacterium salegens]MXO59028.1 MFS transporter [Croceibacterium salegens]